MREHPPKFSAYGDSGDLIGARRTRWAFQYCVIACVMLVAVLWISEYFIGYERAENLYLSALTKHKESARPLLRQAVLRDKAGSEAPNPRYVQALAERELEDEVLPTYQQAFELDPGNATLALRYGCRLFMAGQFEQARDRFRDAALYAPDNALPRYLEATTIPWTLHEEPNILRESLKLIAQANSSGKQIVFPRPLWHPKLPPQGRQYAQLRREAIEECVAPIAQYRDYIMGIAARQIKEKHTQYLDSWLQTLERAGDKLARSALLPDSEGDSGAGSASQAMVGLDLQLRAVRLRQQILEMESGQPDEALKQRESELEGGLAALRDFENARQPVIERDSTAREFACLTAPFFAVFALSVFCALGALAARLLGATRYDWTIPHGRAGLLIMASYALMLGVFLACAPAVQQATARDAVPGLRLVWMILLAATGVSALIYPSLVLPSPKKSAAEDGFGAMTSSERVSAARMRFHRAYAAMARRFLGVTLGLFLCVFSLWALVFRIATSLYPWQVELLATGMGTQEARMVRQALSLLH